LNAPGDRETPSAGLRAMLAREIHPSIRYEIEQVARIDWGPHPQASGRGQPDLNPAEPVRPSGFLRMT